MHRQVGDKYAAVRGLGRGVFPIYVVHSTTKLQTVRSKFSNVWTVERFYSACNGAFVASNHVIMSDSAFESDDVDAGDIVVRDGDFRLAVEEVTINRWLGVAVLRMRDSGMPLEIRDSPFADGQRLVYAGHQFADNPDSRYFADPKWVEGALTVRGEISADGAAAPYFVASFGSAAAPLNACGMPVFDEKGRVAGIFHRRGYGLAASDIVAVHADSIRQVLTVAKSAL